MNYQAYLPGFLVLLSVVVILSLTLQRNGYPFAVTVMFRWAAFWMAAARVYKMGVKEFRYEYRNLNEVNDNVMKQEAVHGDRSS